MAAASDHQEGGGAADHGIGTRTQRARSGCGCRRSRQGSLCGAVDGRGVHSGIPGAHCPCGPRRFQEADRASPGGALSPDQEIGTGMECGVRRRGRGRPHRGTRGEHRGNAPRGGGPESHSRVCPHRRLSGSRTSGAVSTRHRRGRHSCLHRCGQCAGQGVQRPVDGADGHRHSRLRIRRAQGVQHTCSFDRDDHARPEPGASNVLCQRGCRGSRSLA